MYITTGSTPENTSSPTTIVYTGLLSLGVVFALFFTTVLVAKIFWLTMIQTLDQILTSYLLEALKSKSFGHTVI
jgi:hypothetical protein